MVGEPRLRFRIMWTSSVPQRVIWAFSIDLKPSMDPNAALDAPVILFDPIIEVLALADIDRWFV